MGYQAEPQAIARAVNRRREAAGVESHPLDTDQGRQLRDVPQPAHQSEVGRTSGLAEPGDHPRTGRGSNAGAECECVDGQDAILHSNAGPERIELHFAYMTLAVKLALEAHRLG